MKNIGKTLVGVGCLGLIVALITACNFPTIGSGDSEEPQPTESAGAVAQPHPAANTDGAETILIPGVTFWMGSDAGDAQADEDEMPRHQVTLAGFSIYTHEVTNGMYAACVAAGVCQHPDVRASGPTLRFENPEFAEDPVVGVDWNMARTYCAWANARLPTEAEWELASRGADSLLYPWGAAIPDCSLTNMLGCLVPPDTMPVGSFSGGNSPYGLWDMAGNAWEWVHDWYDDDYYALSAGEHPLGPNLGDLKVARGGGQKSESVQLRGATRIGGNPNRSYDDVGFRCVAADPLILPLGYEPAEEMHIYVPPEEDPDIEGDDPDRWFSIGPVHISCPFADDHLEVEFHAEASEPVDYSLRLNGLDYTCTYDAVTEIVHCEGPVPADNETLVFYDFEITVGDIGGAGGNYPRPLDCGEEGLPEFDFSHDSECPEDGWMTINFHYEPTVTWDTIELDGAPIPCWPMGDFDMRCIVPERAPGELYDIFLHGVNPDGDGISWTTFAVSPEDCGLPPQLDVYLEPVCYEGHPSVRVTHPITHLPESVVADGTDLACISLDPTNQVCGDLPGSPGSSAEIFIQLPGEPLVGPDLIEVPDCEEAETTLTWSVDMGCTPEATARMHLLPIDIAVVSADADGTPLTCTDVGGGMFTCTVVPGEGGLGVTINFCLEDGQCFSSDEMIPICGDFTVPGSWSLLATGCHGETMIYFMVETGLEWIVPGADVTFSANDTDNSYACSPHPTVPGRVYCSGLPPAHPGALTFCLQGPSDPAPVCQVFPEFPGWVALIPSCITPTPVIPCSAYSNAAACNATGRCLYDTKSLICRPR